MRNLVLVGTAFFSLAASTGCSSGTMTDGGTGNDAATHDTGTDGTSPGPDATPPRDGATANDAGNPSDAGASPFLRCPSVSPNTDVNQQLPQARVDTAMPTALGRMVRVAAGGNLQTALDGAMDGDTILLAAGATFTGPITVNARTGAGWVVVRTDGAALPAEGHRVGPADAGAMARIVAPAGQAALVAAAGSHHVRFVGIEFTTAGDVYTTALADMGSSVTDVASLPHHFVFDRCYFHGSATMGTRRGIALNSAQTAVVESYFADFREVGADSQAIAGWSGPGPFGIYDNYLEGAAENVMFGGASSHGPGTNPSDIEICGNHFAKPVSWDVMDPSYAGTHWSVKNLFELKNARRVLFAGNLLEHSWGDGQVGFAILLTPRAEGNTSLDHAVTDVTLTANLIRDAAAGVNISSVDDATPGSNVTQRVAVENNLFVGLDGTRWHGAGRTYQVLYGGATGHGLIIDRNTSFQAGNGAMVFGDSAPIFDGFVVRDNVMERATYGVFGSGQGEGTSALMYYLPGYVFTNNVLVGDATIAARYPSGNFFAADDAAVGFRSLSTGDYAFAPNSPYATSSSTGGPVGADATAVSALAAAAQ